MTPASRSPARCPMMLQERSASIYNHTSRFKNTSAAVKLSRHSSSEEKPSEPLRLRVPREAPASSCHGGYVRVLLTCGEHERMDGGSAIFTVGHSIRSSAVGGKEPHGGAQGPFGETPPGTTRHSSRTLQASLIALSFSLTTTVTQEPREPVRPPPSPQELLPGLFKQPR